MKSKVFVALFFISFLMINKGLTQINTLITEKNIKLVTPKIESLIYMYNLSIRKWEKEMKSIGFVERRVDKGGVIYSTGDTFNRGGIQYVAKYAQAVSILWAYSGEKYTIMDELEASLQPHFLNREGEWSTYRFKYGKSSYIIEMKREKDSEHLIFKK